MSETNSRGLRAEKDKKWELVQIKAFTLWVNQTLEPLGYKVNDIMEDLKSGVNLCSFLEQSTNKSLPNRWNKNPAMRVHMIENLGIALRFITSDLAVKLVGIGAEDIADGNLKLTLGLLWSLFVKLRIDTISQGEDTALDGLLSWVRKMTDGYENVKITNFKESFNDGMAFAALVHSMDSDALDFNSLNPADVEKNLNLAFEMAESKLGIPRLLEVEDIVAGNVDERAMILYNSLFFHAWNADAEKRQMKSERESIADQLARLKEENAGQAAELAAAKAAGDDKDARIAALEAEVAFLRKLNAQGNDLRKELEEKIRVLQALLDMNEAALRSASATGEGAGAGGDGAGADGAGVGEGADGGASASADGEGADGANRGLAGDGSATGRGSDGLDALYRQLEDERNGLLLDQDAKDRLLKELEQRRNKLSDEMTALRKQVADEIMKRKAQEALIAELRENLKTLRSKSVVQNRARVGLDVLKANLEEHLEDLYHWRDLNQIGDEDLEGFDLAKITEDLNGKPFEAQLDSLSERLQEENRSISRILKLQDAKEYLNDTALQAGWLMMKGRKDWRRRWFVLYSEQLCFFEDDTCEKLAGSVAMNNECGIVRQQAVTDEESGKKLWPLKLTVGERKLFMRAESKKERHSWFSILTSRISLVKYTESCEASGERPDTRLIGVLKTPSLPAVYLANRPLTTGFVSAFSKGVLGRDELEDLAVANSDLDDAKAQELLGAVAKLPQLKRINFSKNKISGASTEAFTSSLPFKGLEDLDVSHNQLDDGFLSALASRLGEATGLHALGLEGNQFTAAGVQALVAALTAEGVQVTLPELCLSHNKLGDAGVQALLPLMQQVSFKKVLLAGNGITDASAVELAAALAKSEVEEVDLSFNNISGKGAIALRDSMKSNGALYTIRLSGNKDLALDEASAALFAGSGFVLSDLTLTKA